MRITPPLALLFVSFFVPPPGARPDDDKPARQSVFRHPREFEQYLRTQAEARVLLGRKEYAAAERKAAEGIKLAPQYAAGHYLQARALARQGKKEAALASLAAAVQRGFNEVKALKREADLEGLRGEEAFVKLVEAAGKATPMTFWPAEVKPRPVKEGEALVTGENTVWDLRHLALRSAFALGPPDKKKPAVAGYGKAGELVRKWYEDGTAAGNHGDFYDNHDGDHSNLGYRQFPQLTRIEFSDAAKELRLHMGLQDRFLFRGVVLGNSSTALVGGPYWRSQPRLAYASQRRALLLYNQYVNNHLYFYPEHRDHDPGHNGEGEGYGDVYPANTPYVIISQGSSGSDRPFMNAAACTLAAFRPETKKVLIKHGLLMPTVQMLFRRWAKNAAGANDYLTGKAHPTVFEGKNIDVVKMVRAAHDMEPDEVPPMVQLRVVKEDKPALGRDYFDAEPRGDKLFDTPAAIARVMRSTRHTWRMVVSAEGSRDVNGRELTFRWVVLRGDDKAITIKPLNKANSVVELTVHYHERRPISPGAKLASNRVDVGVFVHNGVGAGLRRPYYSAPGFVTFYSLDNQKRIYDEAGRIKVVDYADKEASGNYVDPLVDFKKDWRDEYHYDKEGNRTGWTRKRGEQSREFTADGALVEKKDERGRPLTARTVRYVVRQRKGKTPALEQRRGDMLLHYEYASAADRVGRVKSRERVPSSPLPSGERGRPSFSPLPSGERGRG